MTRYDPKTAEPKWQAIWDERGTFRAAEDDPRPKYYVLEMFPYPSGRLHVGHARNYTIGDVVARYKRAQGFNVLHPDGLGRLRPAGRERRHRQPRPSRRLDPRTTSRPCAPSCSAWASAYDWSREIATCLPEYYRHEQKMFLDFLQAGLAYRKECWVNWDPVEQTVLANEQVIDGRGWRSGAPVEKRKLTQWFLKITAYADELLECIARARPLARPGPAHAGQLDRPLRRCPHALRDRGAHGRARRLHDPAGHALRGLLPRALPGSPPGRRAGPDNPGLTDFIAECHRLGTSEAAIETAEKRGFDTGLDRHPPVRAGPPPAGLCRQLRAHGVRHRRHLRLPGP